MRLTNTRFYTLLLCCTAPFVVSARNSDNASIERHTAQTQFQKPFVFLANEGQIKDQYNHKRKDVCYTLQNQAISIFLKKDGITYQYNKLENPEVLTAMHSAWANPLAATRLKDGKLKISSYRMDVSLIGSNPKPDIVAEDEQEYIENHITSSSSAIEHSYKKITYKNVYHNIDWVFYVKNGKLEYDFVVHKGGNINDIKIRYNGATGIKMGDNGNIIINTPMGSVTEHKPYAYEKVTGREVTTNFQLRNNVLSFNAGEHKGDMVIDPQIQWATYYGASSYDQANAVTTDGSGNVYVTGLTQSSSSVATTGAFQTSYGGNTDAFLAKFSSSGSLLWATYFGDNGNDQGNSAVCDASGNVYFTGITSSNSSIATFGAYQTSYGGGSSGFYNGDAFLAKFSSSGSILWATYYGGSGNDWAYNVALDMAGNVYIGGLTSSSNGIASANGYDTSLSGSYDMFVAKFNGSGKRIWGTYYGGPDYDLLQGLNCDNNCNVYFTGYTYSTSGIATTGAYQTSLSGTYNAVLVKLDSSSKLKWGTYFGASSTSGTTLACDTAGNVYFTGITNATTKIASTGAFKTSLGGGNDAFLAKFDTSGNRKWATYFGGSSNENAYGLAIDNAGNVILGGETFSSSSIATTGAFKTIFGGSSDGFIAKFSPLGQIIWGTYYGGSGTDQVSAGAAFDKSSGAFYFSGYTSSSSAIATTGAYQTTYGGGTDAFIAKFNADTLIAIKQPFTDTFLCAGGTWTVNYTVTYPFASGNTFTVQLSNSSGSFTSPTNIGSVKATSSGFISATIPSGATLGAGYRIRIISSNPAIASPDDYYNIHIISGLPTPTISSNSPVCADGTIDLNANSSAPPVSYTWSGPSGFIPSIANPSIINAKASYSGTYTVTTSRIGCASTSASTSVVVNTTYPAPPVDSSNGPVCEGSTLMLYTYDSILTATYRWTGPNGFTSTLQNPSITSATAKATGTYKVTATYMGCATTDSFAAYVNPPATPSITIQSLPSDTVCYGSSISFVSSITYGGTSPKYQWYLDSYKMIGADAYAWGSSYLADLDYVYCVLTSNDNCITTAVDTSNYIVVSVLPFVSPAVKIIASPGTNVAPGTAITFTALATDTGSVTSYQWYVNGSPVPGANAASYITNTLSSGDSVYVQINTSPQCATNNNAVSNILKVHFSTGIAVQNMSNNFVLYPNPNNGTFTVKGDINDISAKEATLQVMNTIGQVVYQEKIPLSGTSFNKQIALDNNLPAGIYMLMIQTRSSQGIIRFTKQ